MIEMIEDIIYLIKKDKLKQAKLLFECLIIYINNKGFWFKYIRNIRTKIAVFDKTKVWVKMLKDK